MRKYKKDQIEGPKLNIIIKLRTQWIDLTSYETQMKKRIKN